MGGSPIKREPTDHTLILQDQDCEPLYKVCGWLDYFLKLHTYGDNVALEFA